MDYKQGVTDQQMLCCKVVNKILEADAGEDCMSAVGNSIRNSSCAKEIQTKFEAFSLSSFENVTRRHQCPSQEPSTKSSPRSSLRKVSTFPKTRGRSSHSESQSGMYRKARLDRRSVASLPANLAARTNLSEPFSELSSSVTSDDATVFSSSTGNVSRVSSPHRGSYKFPAGDFDVYKASSLCVQNPTVAQRLLGPTEEIALKKRSTRSTRKVLGHYLRCIFHPLSKSKHRQYQAMLFELDADCSPDQLTRLQMFAHLRQVESDEHPYYKSEHFQTNEDYQKWRSEEQAVVFNLLGSNFPSDRSVYDSAQSHRNRVDDYRSLLLKMIKHEAGCNIERADSVPMALCDISLAESSNSSLESVHRGTTLLPAKAERLLCEFGQLFRVTAVTRRVVYVQCVKDCCQDEILEFGDLKVLRDLQVQISELLQLLEESDGKNFILTQELEDVIELTDHMIEWIKQLLNTFITGWKPDHDQLSTALALLERCLKFQATFGVETEVDFLDCVRQCFESATRDEYVSHRHLRCDCRDPCGQSLTLKLLRTVRHSITVLQQTADRVDHRSIFEQYLPDIESLSAAALYDCVLSDVAALGESMRLKLASERFAGDELELRASVVVASSLAEFERLVLDTGYALRDVDVQRSWRSVFCDFAPLWLQFVRRSLTVDILECVRDDESVSVQVAMPCGAMAKDASDDESSSASSSDCIITRVEEAHASHAVPAAGDEMNEQVHGRLRMNIIVSYRPRDEPHALLKESTFTPASLPRTGLQADLREGRGDEVVTSLCFARSALDFVVALNRFVAFTSNIVDAIFRPPGEWRDKKMPSTSKEAFSALVFSAMSGFIRQYSDCVLNLDLCKFPKAKASQFVTREKQRELKKRRQERTISCCRHQMEDNTLPCVDEDVKQEHMFKKKAVYSKMARRANSVFLVCEGLNAIWEQLSYALDIPQPSSTGTSMKGFSSSTMSIAANVAESEYVGSDASHQTARSDNSSDEGHTTTAARLSGASCDDNNNDCEGKADIAGGAANHTYAKAGRVRDRSFTTAATGSSQGQERRTNRSDLRRGRSATEGCSSSDSTIVGDLDSTKASIQASVKSVSQSLFSMLGFRIAQPVVKLLSETLSKFGLRLRLRRGSLPRDLLTCEDHCRPVVALLSRVLEKTGDWFYGRDAIKRVQGIVWKELAAKLSLETQSLKDCGESSKSLAFLLLVTYRILIKKFNSVGELTIEDLSENLQSTLSVLELFLMPTDQVVGLYNDAEEDAKIDLHNSGRPVDPHLMRCLCRLQKSFAGHQFLAQVKSLSRKANHLEVDMEAQELCSSMLARGIIKLVFVRNSTKKLPGLVEYGDSITSSCESVASDTAWAEKTPDSSQRAHTSNSGSSSASQQESDNDSDLTSSAMPFSPDFAHYYAFATDRPLYHFDGPGGENLRAEFLEEVLCARSRQDEAAKEFLRRKGKLVKRWFHFCSCIS